MAMHESVTVVGVFVDPARAEGAVDELRRAGFDDKQVGYVGLREALAEGTHPGSGPEMDLGAETGEQAAHEFTGALKGTAIGGLLGAAAALIPGVGPILAGGVLGAALLGAGAGAAAGGLLGALQHAGLSEEDARAYEPELRAGRVLLVVRHVSRHAEAADILRRHGAATRPS
jgi:hypothetical protein